MEDYRFYVTDNNIFISENTCCITHKRQCIQMPLYHCKIKPKAVFNNIMHKNGFYLHPTKSYFAYNSLTTNYIAINSF